MPSRVKFDIIHNVVTRDNNLLSIEHLCELAGVSRSGYYNWLGSAGKRAEREESDKADFELVLEA